ncbi:MAG: hypothetical protein H7245_20330 [Candidatus Saccharibacteria bacterium]|nr:hypothetical protein [Pseudorhodobacter sp.]
MIWALAPEVTALETELPRRTTIDPAKIEEAMAIGADFVATSFETAQEEVFATKPAVPLPAVPTKAKIGGRRRENAPMAEPAAISQ